MNHPRDILLVLAALAALGMYLLWPSDSRADTHVLRVTVHEDSHLLRTMCPGALACRVGHQVLIPGDSGVICDRAVAVVVHPEPQGRAWAEWRDGAIHTVRLTWRHRGVAELGDALQQACGYWRRATTALWGHELMHLLGRKH